MRGTYGFIEGVKLRFSLVRQDSFIKSIGLLVGSTALGQALTVLVLPLLTRLYTPEDFSVLALYGAILGIISVAACLRLEIAIPLPESDEDAANLLLLALCSSFGVAVILTISLFTLSDNKLDILIAPILMPHLWLLPLGIWLTSTYAALQFWATRKKRFAAISGNRIVQAVGGATTQVGLGWAGITPVGLLLGQVINSSAGIFGLMRDMLRSDIASFRSVSWSSMRRTLCEYSQFPKYSMLESLANSAGNQVPIIIIATVAVGGEAGLLLLATKVMMAPMTLIGGAVAQVYISNASEEHRSGNLRTYTAGVIGGLFKAGVGPLLFLGIIAPTVFTMVFGQNWQRAGDMVLLMMPWLAFQFMASPISMALHVAKSQKIALALQIFGALIRVGPVGIAAILARDQILETYFISGFIFYFFYFYFVMVTVGMRITDLLSALRPGAILTILWISSAILLRTVYEIFI